MPPPGRAHASGRPAGAAPGRQAGRRAAREVDTVILAGMGGQLMIRLLEDGRAYWGAVERLLLAPNRDQQALRVVLRGAVGGWKMRP